MFLYLVPTLQTTPLLGLTRTTDCRRRSLLRTSALRPEMTALREMARLLADVCNYCVVVVDTTSELVCIVELYEWTLRARAQTAQQLGLTRTTARGFRA